MPPPQNPTKTIRKSTKGTMRGILSRSKTTVRSMVHPNIRKEPRTFLKSQERYRQPLMQHYYSLKLWFKESKARKILERKGSRRRWLSNLRVYVLVVCRVPKLLIQAWKLPLSCQWIQTKLKKWRIYHQLLKINKNRRKTLALIKIIRLNSNKLEPCQNGWVIRCKCQGECRI